MTKTLKDLLAYRLEADMNDVLLRPLTYLKKGRRMWTPRVADCLVEYTEFALARFLCRACGGALRRVLLAHDAAAGVASDALYYSVTSGAITVQQAQFLVSLVQQGADKTVLEAVRSHFEGGGAPLPIDLLEKGDNVSATIGGREIDLDVVNIKGNQFVGRRPNGDEMTVHISRITGPARFVLEGYKP